MRYPTALPAAALVALLLLLSAITSLPLSAKSSEWQDLAGTKFKGEPVEILGPFALFKTGQTTGRRMRLRGLSPENIRRLHQELAARPARAPRWLDATGSATRELIGNTLRLEYEKLVPANLSSVPEPDLLLLLFGSHNDGESWEMLRSITAVYERARRVYPGRLEAVFLGVRHNESEHRRIAATTYMPWLVADFSAQSSLRLFNRFAPAEGAHLLLISRDGIPLLNTRVSSLGDTQKFADELSALLAALDPSNPRSWPDRFHYLDLTRPIDFANATTGPLLLGDPLRADGLRQRGVSRIEARLALTEDGSVTDITLLPGSEIPEPMKTPLLAALKKQAALLPAIDHGKPVAATFDYTFVVPPENKTLAADIAWLNGEARNDIALPSWLILNPIQVQERDFSNDPSFSQNQVERVADDDTVMLKALKVSTAKVSGDAQRNAFNTDWFTEAGADSVRPTEGAPQHIDGHTLTWKRVAAPEGRVDFGESEYTVAYAWTEFDSPSDVDAWLGLGSDDGVKTWLNGQLVNDRWIRRMSRIDDDVVPLRLKKGKNRLLIKIQNATGGGSFIARIRTR
jgi:hypothetical protein